jgi:hypothetical protein
LTGRGRKPYQNVSRETFLSGWGLKSYKGHDSGPLQSCKIDAIDCLLRQWG